MIITLFSQIRWHSSRKKSKLLYIYDLKDSPPSFHMFRTNTLNNSVEMLINRPMGADILKLDRDRKLLNDDVTWAQQFDRKSVEFAQKHVNKCEQSIIPEYNANILLKLGHEWHAVLSVWAGRNLRRGRWFRLFQRKRNCGRNLELRILTDVCRNSVNQ